MIKFLEILIKSSNSKFYFSLQRQQIKDKGDFPTKVVTKRRLIGAAAKSY